MTGRDHAPSTAPLAVTEEDALARLNELSSRLWQAASLEAGLDEIVPAAMGLLGAAKGNIQLLDPARGVLEIAAQVGFEREFLDVFREVSIAHESACGRALRTRARIVIADTEADVEYAPMRPIARRAGYRAVQSSPLFGRDGQPLGMLSTHFAAPHRPGATDLRRLDLLLRHAADFIERCRHDQALERSERALQAREAELALIATSTPVILVRCSRDLRYRFINRAGAELFGLAPEQIIGRPIREVMNDRAFAVIRPHIERVLAGDTIEYEEEITYHGTPRWMRVQYLPDRDADGAVVGWIASIVDVTERRRTEQVNRFLVDASAALAEVTDERAALGRIAGLAVPAFADLAAVDLVGADGTLERVEIMSANAEHLARVEAMRHRYGRDRSHLRGLASMLRSGRCAELIETVTDEVLAGWARDDRHLADLRAVGMRSYLATPLVSRGRIVGALTFLMCDSGRRYGEAERRAAEDLAHRAVVAIENARLYRALQEADRRKDEFIAMLAHELRNPLAPVRNASLHLKRLNPADEELRRPIEMIDRQVTLMSRLIDDLMDVSRISRGRLELRPSRVVLSELIEAAVDGCRHEIDGRRHQLQVALPEEPVALAADRARLIQVLSNLIVNAARYSDPGGRIDVTAAVTDAKLQIAVRDQGIGIPREKLGEIFDLFAQLDRSSERQGGLGIGLTLARQITELHGGTIEARSEGEGRGSEFVLWLPILAAPSGPAAVLRRILVADDNRDAAESLAMLLERAGHEVHLAYDGAAALAAAGTLAPELVLLDIGMPEVNGYEVARGIRSQPWGRSMVLVALTGWGHEDDKRRAREAGFDAHLVKPVPVEALERLLAGLPAMPADSATGAPACAPAPVA